MPVVDLLLQPVAVSEQIPIRRRQRRDDFLEASPEVLRFKPDFRQELVFDELVQHGGNAQATYLVSITRTH